MMGMVYKDLYVLRKQAAYYLVFLVLYAVLVAAGVFPSAILAGLVVLVGMMLPMSSFGYDDQARWDKYAVATPAGRQGVVGGKYLFTVLITLAAALVAFAAQLVLVLLGVVQGSAGEAALVVLACAGMSLVTNAIILPLLFKFGAEKSRIISMVIFVAVFGGIIVLLPLLENANLPAIPGWLLGALPAVFGLVSVGGFAVSYFISSGIYGKKEL